ncbi:hypothetical protein HLH26_05560 [Gluconacetobacter sp. 1b LMG 1731]|uniref:Uncharacterized protein n=1 Tax=Gluconacetobacter dulcium TaxID=2729096 RepID=A0A7W4NV40_9PROT|nr:hypothetical protein [Gluconacetobacter dulcium]MBB2164010.1 hypothetical protein [Gluconacetobacter dulcium]MBB2192714.1 hypothetical protein [Gluconacetobacter dulcium]
MGNPYATEDEGSVAALAPVHNCLHALRSIEKHTVTWDALVNLGVLTAKQMTVEKDTYEQSKRDRYQDQRSYPDLSGEAEAYFKKTSEAVAFFANKKRAEGRRKRSTAAKTSAGHAKRVRDEKALVRKHETALEDAQGIWDEMTPDERSFFREPREGEIEATLHMPVMVRRSEYELTGSGESEKEILNRTMISIVEDYLRRYEKPLIEERGRLLDAKERFSKLRRDD